MSEGDRGGVSGRGGREEGVAHGRFEPRCRSRTREAMPDRDDAFFVDPAGVAETAWHLVYQDGRAWSFEVGARPLGDPW